MRLREIVAPVVSVLAPRRRRSPEAPDRVAAERDDRERESPDGSDAQVDAAGRSPAEASEKGGLDRYA